MATTGNKKQSPKKTTKDKKMDAVQEPVEAPPEPEVASEDDVSNDTEASAPDSDEAVAPRQNLTGNVVTEDQTGALTAKFEQYRVLRESAGTSLGNQPVMLGIARCMQDMVLMVLNDGSDAMFQHFYTLLATATDPYDSAWVCYGVEVLPATAGRDIGTVLSHMDELRNAKVMKNMYKMDLAGINYLTVGAEGFRKWINKQKKAL